MNKPLRSPNPFADDRVPGADVFDPRLDVVSVHASASQALREQIERARTREKLNGEAKVVILRSRPGLGKTHVFGRVGYECDGNVLFVYVPQVEEHGSPVKHVHWHVLDTLFRARPGRRPILHTLLARLCQDSFRCYLDALPFTVKQRHQSLRDRLDTDPDTVLEIIAEAREFASFQPLASSMAIQLSYLPSNIVRALALGWSQHANEAWYWLRGDPLDESVLSLVNLPNETPTTTSLLKTLAGLLKRVGMGLVICCDQSEQLLERPDAMKELTTNLMGWLDTIPNTVLALSFMKDGWANLNLGYQAFLDRSRVIDLDYLSGPQAVELIRRRLADWPKKHPDRGPLWPFREDDIVRFTEKEPVPARGLLRRCCERLDDWLAKQTDSEISICEQLSKPIEELFRQKWSSTLQEVSRERLAPQHIQEERLFRAACEAIHFAQLAKTPIGGLEVLQFQPGALANSQKYHSLQLKLGVRGSDVAFPVVVAATNLTGGNPMTNFLKALDQAVTDPVAGAVLVRPSADLAMGPNTDGRKKYEALVSCNKLRPFALADNRSDFEHMECYLRLLDQAKSQNLQLGSETVTAERCQQLAVKTQTLSGLTIFGKVFCDWPQASVVSVQAATPAAAIGVSVANGESAMQSTITQIDRQPAPKLPNNASQASENTTWANRLLNAVAAKLIEFGQKVEPLAVDIGPTFARLKLKPLGRTSVGRVRNNANNLRAHLKEITTVPVIADQPGYISVDVERPDRQSVYLKDCLPSVAKGHKDQPVFPVGVDVSGNTHWLDLAEPSTCHLLVAGTTGSGKSEFLKSMLAGLAAHLSPLELRFVLIDPKHVTFNFPGESPYLLHPVAHTIEEAMPLVQGCFEETERRYQLLKSRGLEHIGQLRGKDALHRIVVVFDEFADLMADRQSKKELETSLKRIGALARAAGIHLVLATQRPDRDVVTPLLKANLPTRICLHVEGERNSKIVLDETGGENLLGHGDLFWKHGSGMVRLQGAFVAKPELEQLLRFTS